MGAKFARGFIRGAAEEAKRVERFNSLAGEDGVISPEEFAAKYPNLGADRIAELFAGIDADASGGIGLDEFTYDHHAIAKEDWIAAREAAQAAAAEEKRVARFEALAGEDGSISPEEFAAKYPNLGADRSAELFAGIDADASGGIGLDEFTYDREAIAEEDRAAARAAAEEAKRVERFNSFAGEESPDSITLEEFTAGAPSLEATEAEALFTGMDADGSGEVTLDEFNYEGDDDDHNHHGGRRHSWRYSWFTHRR